MQNSKLENQRELSAQELKKLKARSSLAGKIAFFVPVSLMLFVGLPIAMAGHLIAAPIFYPLVGAALAIATITLGISMIVKHFSDQKIRNCKNNIARIEESDATLSQNEKNTDENKKENAMTHAAKNSDNSSKISFFPEVVKNDNPVQNQPAPMSPCYLTK